MKVGDVVRSTEYQGRRFLVLLIHEDKPQVDCYDETWGHHRFLDPATLRVDRKATNARRRK